MMGDFSNSHGNSQESAPAKNIRSNSKSAASTRHTRATIWMILPLYIFTLIFVACPLIYMVALSFATPGEVHAFSGSLLWIITGSSWNQCTWTPLSSPFSWPLQVLFLLP